MMGDLWKKATQQLSTLNQREKVLLLLVGLIIIPGIIDFFLIQPLRDSGTIWRQQTEIINQRMTSFTPGRQRKVGRRR